MKNIILALAVLFTLASCVKDRIQVSGDIVTQEYAFTDIDALDISGEFEVFVDISTDNPGVRAELNKELVPYVSIENNNGTLRVRYNRSLSTTGRIKNKIYLTTDQINKVNTSGENTVTVSGTLATDNLDINMSGESGFVSMIDVDNLIINLTGESDINLSGSATDATIRMSGESKLTDYDFVIDDLHITMSGESKVRLHVDKTIDITTSGESEFRYMGTATITRESTSGESEINKVG